MKLIIESTDVLTLFDDTTTPCRLWAGTTEDGTPCRVFVHRIAAVRQEDRDAFDRAKQQLPPGRVVPLETILREGAPS